MPGPASWPSASAAAIALVASLCLVNSTVPAKADDDQLPAPSPSPSASPQGPCVAPALASIAVRPGIGRAPATGGAVCVAQPGVVVLSLGYRDQATTGTGRQELVVYPEPTLIVGLRSNTELLVAPSLSYSLRIGSNGSVLPPVSGLQDSGIGLQRMFADSPWAQQSVELFATFPTGYPAGPTGYSAGAPTYQLSYSIAVPLNARLGASLSAALLVASAGAPTNSVQRYLAFVPSANLSFSASPAMTLLLEDQIGAPSAPHGPTANRVLFGIQQALSPNVVVDVDYETNALPPPGFNQHTTFEAGVTLRL